MKTAAVVGLGTMGPGIAATLAKGGMDVRTYDLKPEVVEKAKGDDNRLREAALQALKRSIKEATGKRPAAEVHLVRV